VASEEARRVGLIQARCVYSQEQRMILFRKRIVCILHIPVVYNHAIPNMRYLALSIRMTKESSTNPNYSDNMQSFLFLGTLTLLRF
jgi:hypothetical protein